MTTANGSRNAGPATAGAGVGRRLRRGCLIGLTCAAAAIVVAQVGWSPPERFVVLRADGSPAAGAVVAFHYYGHRFNLVHSTTYERSGGIVRADAAGRVEIPGRLYRKAPLDEYLEPWIDLLYDAGSHAAFEAGLRNVSLPGRYEFRGDGRDVVVADHATDPRAWERTLEALHSMLAYELVYPALDHRAPDIRASNAEVRALAGALASEHQSFLERYQDTPRQPPALDPYLASRPAAEQQEFHDNVRADLERAPLWGDHLARWPDDLEELERAIARLD